MLIIIVYNISSNLLFNDINEKKRPVSRFVFFFLILFWRAS